MGGVKVSSARSREGRSAMLQPRALKVELGNYRETRPALKSPLPPEPCHISPDLFNSERIPCKP